MQYLALNTGMIDLKVNLGEVLIFFWAYDICMKLCYLSIEDPLGQF